ncbi:hypothetical protein OQH61_03180 [Helicobacter sp. MIT 21-1697]|uniref:hypothetical protein n=1 Tax=Helicobacter sp. MIT 21-1697 TaxID=2993733 RepID=UPI00224AC855|nr:hypothetical protein [Helicobacter sp. MIT 21-1697]MCX2716735.1 hypothetical protein [Helicobacter sp. MIT 21-1697]
MSKLDKEKEKIGILKFWLGIVVATFLAIGGWLATNIHKTESLLLVCGSLSLIGLFIAGFLLNKRINKHINNLEDL